MTYCVGVKLEEGLIFASDSRTHAGVDNYAKFCKMTVFDRAGDRVLAHHHGGCLFAASDARRCDHAHLTPEHSIMSDESATSGFPLAMMMAKARPYDHLALTGGGQGRRQRCLGVVELPVESAARVAIVKDLASADALEADLDPSTTRAVLTTVPGVIGCHAHSPGPVIASAPANPVHRKLTAALSLRDT